MNDPVAVIFVLACIEGLTDPNFGWRRRGPAARPRARHRRGRRAGRRARSPSRASARANLETPGLYPVASLATAALAFGGADVAARVGLPRRLPRRPDARQRGRSPRARRSPRSTRGWAGWRSSRCSRRSGCSSSRPASTTSPSRARSSRSSSCFVARPLAVLVATLPMGFSFRERLVLDWAGLRGAVPVVLATFPVIEGVEGSVELFDIVFFAVLLSTLLQGSTFEWLRRDAGDDDEHARAPAAAGRGGDDPPPRRRGARVPDHGRGRDRRRRRARPRPAPRRGGQRDRPRRPGDPAPRLDAPAPRRPPPRAAAHRRRQAGAGAARALEQSGPIGPPVRPPRADPRPPPGVLVVALAASPTATPRTVRELRGVPDRRAAAHPPRLPGRAVGARRRPLRPERAARRDRLATGSDRLGAKEDRARRSPTSAPGCRRSSARSRATCRAFDFRRAAQ